MSFVERGEVVSCLFDGHTSYEELGIRYYNRDIVVHKNTFAGKGPWRNNIEIALVNADSGLNVLSKGMQIYDKLFQLHGAKQDVMSSHAAGDVVFRNNRVEVMSDLLPTTDSGSRSLVKRFDTSEGSLIVDGNEFDFRNTPEVVTIAFEVVRVWSDNVIVKNNIIRARSDRFTELDDSYGYRWLGAGKASYNPQGVIISDNLFELYDYTATLSFIIKASDAGTALSNNILVLKS